ncbi:hypothetical protein ABID08_004946 [Rhizobium binae]|uniref:Uncharacterized protein n=1 Tax=Rhizobium binae TaxID=1138190 RepID=A0ABV2MM96_9HYPH|nr:hypothetical protein [Rhizobium binae]MBX4993784.1 hypothetical protein [Rhizobium binae]NKL46849.1 hypothetical protein [Rhizobium leguminosarum bv. viciae]QSY83334.1 hypothetical protein J2J99_05860 [Rhizobium binae]
MAVISWALAPWKSVACDGVMAPMSADLASDGVGANSSRGYAQSSGAAAWRMEEFALAYSYDCVEAIYKLNIDHVYIADL